MSTQFARFVGRRRGRIAGLVTAITVVLGVALPAWASGASEPSATLAPIGTGSYLLTITTGAEPITSLGLVGENITNVAPAGICASQTDGVICAFATVPPMTSKQFCYSGPAVTEVGFNLIYQVKVSSAPAVASCPVPGFTPASSGGGGGAGGGGSSGGGSSGGGGSTQPPPTSSPTVKCKKGFKKKTVHGKAKCVKVKKHKH